MRYKDVGTAPVALAASATVIPGRSRTSAIERDGAVVQFAPTFHALRHTHASALIAGGWDMEEVSARLGHTSVATTQRIYVHEFDAARRSDDRRRRLVALYGAGVEAPVEASEDSTGPQTATVNTAEA